MKEDVSRQRIAQIRICILRDIIVWTLHAPYRIVLFPALWETFHWLVYPDAQKFKDGKKLCISCQKLGRECWHPIEDFYKRERLRGGIETYCKRCSSEKSMKYAKKHTDKALEYNRKYRETHRDRFREYDRKYYLKHREERIAYITEWKKRKRGASL